jgi:hypothetical protein
MTSYITLLSKIEQFCNAHLQIKKYGGEFREQMPNFSTQNEKYPVVFVEPISDLEDLNTNQFSINVYCVDIIQKDRANLNSIVSDCQLILKDMYVYYTNDMDIQLDVVGTSSMTPVNNFDSDYVAGWVMTITFEVDSYGACEIPMNPIIPVEVECQDGSVENSNRSYTATVPSGGSLVLPDVRLQVFDQNENLLSDETYPSVQDETISVYVAPCEDASYRIADENNNTLYQGTIVSGGSLNQTINNTSVSNSNDSYTASVLAEGNLELPDVTFRVNNSVGTQVLSTTIPSVTNQTLVAPDGVVHIKHEADGTIANVSTPSGATTEYIIQNNDITVNAANPFIIHAEEPLDIRIHNQNGNDITPTSVTYNGNQHYVTAVIDTASFVPVGATLLKTGQTTSYATGDDGATQRGRATSFLVLSSNNPFGNTNRFTSKTGTQTYTNSVAIDWTTYNGTTVLAYYFGDTNTRAWATQLTQYQNSLIDGLRGWNLYNINEAMNIMNFSYPSSYLYNYAPFNLSRRYHWVSTNQTGTTGIITETAAGSGAPFTTASKTNALWGIWTRVCTVSGTTIS